MSETVEAAAPEAATAEDVRAEDVRAPIAADAANEGMQEEGAEDGEAEAPPELVEYRFGAKALTVPKGAVPEDVDAALREFTEGVQGDYTRKTQALAEDRKAVEAERAALQQTAALTAEAQQAQVAFTVFDAQAKALREQITPALWQSNPDQARRVSDEAAMYEAAAAQQRQIVAGHHAQLLDVQQRATAERHERGVADVRRAIPGFDAKAEGELIRYAVDALGVTEAEARAYGVTPKLAVAVWKAAQFDRLQAASKAAVAAKPPAAPAGPVKAVAKRGGNASRSPDQMSDDEYYRWRTKELAKRR